MSLFRGGQHLGLHQGTQLEGQAERGSLQGAREARAATAAPPHSAAEDL